MELTSLGQEISPALFGRLRDSSEIAGDSAALQKRMNEDGYVFLRDALDVDTVWNARAAIFSRLAEVGEVVPPAIDGTYSGTSRRAELAPDLGAFWKSICDTPALRAVTHGGPIISTMERLLGGPVRPFDFLWLRPVPPGRASAFHYDHVYMNRGTDNLYTVWTPLGNAPLEDGPILLMEGSHRWRDVIEQFRGLDIDKDSSRPGHVTMEPVTLANERGCRLLSEDFRPGDMLIMSMWILHGSLDNRSTNRLRLSCDTRYQLASEPIDERWVGENPIAHGQGYASMSGAKPLTAPPIRR